MKCFTTNASSHIPKRNLLLLVKVKFRFHPDIKSREGVPGGIPPRVIYRFPIVSITLKGILYSIVGNYEADFKIGIYKIKQRNKPRGGGGGKK